MSATPGRSASTDSTGATHPVEPRRYDLEERLIDFAVAVCRLLEELPPTALGQHVARQLMRSATSAAPNYAEAQAAESRRDFVHKMRLCLKELRETLVWLKMVDRLGLTRRGTLAHTIQEAGELTAVFVSSIATATRNSRRSKRQCKV